MRVVVSLLFALAAGCGTYSLGAVVWAALDPEHAGSTPVRVDVARDGDSPKVEPEKVLGARHIVRLFSDLRRHDLGPENASHHEDHGVPPREHLTRRLWGLASSPPWFYDGRAASLDAAIEAHGGDAIDSRSAFQALAREDQGALRIYLLSLTRERRLVIP